MDAVHVPALPLLQSGRGEVLLLLLLLLSAIIAHVRSHTHVHSLPTFDVCVLMCVCVLFASGLQLDSRHDHLLRLDDGVR
jgi:hypothetical protein